MRILVLFVLIFLAACGGSASNVPQPPAPPLLDDLVWDEGNWDEIKWQ